jgi:Tol biopolymer transport system component
MLFDATARERKVLARWQEPDRLDLAAWSPSGDVIACAIARPEGTRLAVVPVNGGAPRPLGVGRWLTLDQISWRDRSSLLFAGTTPDAFWFTPVWRVTYPQGEVRRITPDVGAYGSVSVAVNQVVAVKRETSVEVSLPREGRSFSVSSAGEIAFDVAWTPGGNLLYTSDITGRLEIWSAGPGGENRRQLTHGAGASIFSSMCGDGQHIIFASNRTGDLRFWRMDPDGGNPVVLTGPVLEFADCSPDGRWVVYANQDGTWKISVDGGQPQRLTTEVLEGANFSPDGALVAGYKSGQVKVFRSTGGQVLHTLTADPDWFTRVKWSPDGRGIDFIKDDIWRVPLSGGPAARLSGLSCPGCSAFSWSRDGKRLACARIIETRDVVLISGIP